MQHNQEQSKKNLRTALMVFGVVFAMIVLSFASVPLYDLFCRVTGYGGTTQVAVSVPDKVIDYEITVNLDATSSRDLPWDFRPEQRRIVTRPGQKSLVTYNATNLSKNAVAGMALYNVVPPKAGKYFHKIQCFCFDEMVLEGQQNTKMPVLFFVDPEIVNDPQMKDVKTITLSYTFYKIDTKALEEAEEQFYNSSDNAEADI